MVTIHEILKDPRYRQFAAAVTAEGRPVNPDCWPWKYLGLTDAEFMVAAPKCEDGNFASEDLKRDWLGVVRVAELEVVRLWNWWLGWSWISSGRTAAQVRTETEPSPSPAVPTAKPPAGMLF